MMRRSWLVLAVAVATGAIVASVATSIAILPSKAALEARLMAIKSYLAQTSGWTEQEAKEFLQEVKNLKAPNAGAIAQAVTEAAEILAEFEKVLHIKGIWAKDKTAEPVAGEEVLLFGTVSSAKITDSGHLIMKIGEWSAVSWNWPRDEVPAKVGQGVAILGKVKFWKGSPEVEFQEGDIWVAGKPAKP